MSTKKETPRRQIFVLTPEEKKTIVFVLCALILGMATKHYRDAHPRPLPSLSSKEQRAAKKAAHSKHDSPSPTPTTSASE